jgi:anti-sigma B factor antagonist
VSTVAVDAVEVRSGLSASREPARPCGLDVHLDRSHPSVLLLHVAGEIDTLTAPALEAALGELLSAEPADALAALELSEVGFLASSGLAALIRAAHRAEAQGRELHLVGGSRAVTRPLQVTGSDRLFVLHDDLAALSSGPYPGQARRPAD